MICILMGVSGAGKTTVGRILATELGLPFYDADDFHPGANVAKMRQGIALTDADRQAWLEGLAVRIAGWEREGGAVIACSALKEAYRAVLQRAAVAGIRWVYLEGDKALIEERLRGRTGHFMPASLLDSQLEALEAPVYALRIDIAAPPEVLARQIASHLETKDGTYPFGVLGLGVMGKSLALNLAHKGVRVALYNRHVPGKEEKVAQRIVDEHPGLSTLTAHDDLAAFVASLERPRKILMMIVAGPAVDAQIDALLPLLSADDVVIDGGNSFYQDTARRVRALAERQIELIGTGISGGAEGARLGPSMMPGGSKKGWETVRRHLELMAAKDEQGRPCAAYMGPEGAGHFVKMVHNGIEYAEMQVLAECYQLMRAGLQLDPEAIASVLIEWRQQGLESYLLDITIDILRKREGDGLLLDRVLDQAEQKGTGGWSVAAALEHGVAYGPLSEAVMARALSARKETRLTAARLHGHHVEPSSTERNVFLGQLCDAYRAARIINHHVGFALMWEVSRAEQWGLDLSDVARIWTRGCIIRSSLMEELVALYAEGSELLLAPSIVARLGACRRGFASVVAEGLKAGIALPALCSALSYYLGYQTAASPANLIQAQRDYFGAHTYRRIDQPPDRRFHSDWRSRGRD